VPVPDVTVSTLPPGAWPDAAPRAAGVRMVLEGEACLETSGTVLTLARGDAVRTRDVPPGSWRAGDAGVRWVDVLGAEDSCPRPCPKRGACRPLARVHRWAMTEAVLAQAARAGSFPRIARYGTPRADLTRTLRVEVHRLDPGRWTPSVRSGHRGVTVVLAGAGASVVGGRRFSWEAGDVFAIPPELEVDHRAGETADLLIVSALG
jgi:quercetin dioxygenase-like cupin family protein